MNDDTGSGRSVASGVWWTAHRGSAPIVGTAIHEGHNVRPALRDRMALSEEGRLREEDPFTEFFIRDLENRIVFHRSRFEVDLNRAREGAVYLTPDQAWGLDVWQETPPGDLVEEALSAHDAYYAMLDVYLRGIEARYGRFVLLDIHSYNHRRNGPDAPPSDREGAPDINIGTISMDREKWAPVIDAFIGVAASFDFRGRRLDVRENIAFQGRGEQTRFVHEHFPETGCAIAVEFKKFFMDEWTGEPDPEALVALRDLINATLPAIEKALREVG
jgi:hypothetical protein